MTFAALAKEMPLRRRGRPAHVATLHRWRARGLHGVRLEAVRIGGPWYTSAEAYARFCSALTSLADRTATTATRRPSYHGEPPAAVPKSVENRLDEIGISPPVKSAFGLLPNKRR
jgi:hypothetical protein